MRRLVRVLAFALAAALAPSTARAEWQIKPFGGVTFGGDTALLVDYDRQAGKPKLNLGVSSVWLGNVIGIEGDIATTARLLQRQLALEGHAGPPQPRDDGDREHGVRAAAADCAIRAAALRGSRSGYDARRRRRQLGRRAVSNWLAAWDIGGGATGFLSDVVGVNWDVRMFRTLQSGVDTSGTKTVTLSFWRATMGFTFRL
ncbi:MAG: hypothetical protein QM736_10830 [Vicinamibacterales bacterium]